MSSAFDTFVSFVVKRVLYLCEQYKLFLSPVRSTHSSRKDREGGDTGCRETRARQVRQVFARRCFCSFSLPLTHNALLFRDFARSTSFSVPLQEDWHFTFSPIYPLQKRRRADKKSGSPLVEAPWSRADRPEPSGGYSFILLSWTLEGDRFVDSLVTVRLIEMGGKLSGELRGACVVGSLVFPCISWV